ncbi:MAG TPA: hypothetical protein ENH33_07265 [Actinobacteria bacterium]|nr:hypothetical protein [Actinomycetota bacterium]
MPQTIGPFRSIDVDCALRLADGSVFRFATSADLTGAKDLEDAGLALGAAAANAMSTMGDKVGAAEIKALSTDLAKARATIKTLTEKHEAAKAPPPPQATEPKPKRSTKRS